MIFIDCKYINNVWILDTFYIVGVDPQSASVCVYSVPYATPSNAEIVYKNSDVKYGIWLSLPIQTYNERNKLE